MRIDTSEITFTFDREELRHLREIVLFALDLHAERTMKKEPCMTDDEEKFAAKLNKVLSCYN